MNGTTAAASPTTSNGITGLATTGDPKATCDQITKADVQPAAYGALCNRVYCSGNTTPDLSALTSAGNSGTSRSTTTAPSHETRAPTQTEGTIT